MSPLFRRKKHTPSAPALVPWGEEVHPDHLGPHFAVMGQNGSGKTLTIRMLLRALLTPGGALRQRALIYDPKLDFYPILRGMGVLPEAVHVLNPFDRRGCAWDVAADVDSHAVAQELSATLLPRERGETPYFSKTARVILTELIDTLRTKAAASWNLADLVQLVSTAGFERVLERGGERARATLKTHVTDNAKETVSNIRSTLQASISAYDSVASIWGSAEVSKMNLRQWMRSSEAPSILLLGSYAEANESIQQINRAIFRRCAQLLRMKEENSPDKTWIVLDELRIAQELDTLPETLLTARSKGGRFVLGFQDIHGLREVYGRDRTEELVAQIHNFAVFRTSSPDTVDWASRYFGTKEWWAPSYGRSDSFNGSSSTTNYSLQERRQVLAERIRDLRPPTHSFGLEGIFSTPFIPPWHRHLSPEFLARYLGRPSDAAEDVGFLPRSRDERSWPPYTRGLEDSLGLALPAAAPQQPPPESSGGLKPSLF